jgi:hypothetical protein
MPLGHPRLGHHALDREACLVDVVLGLRLLPVLELSF